MTLLLPDSYAQTEQLARDGSVPGNFHQHPGDAQLKPFSGRLDPDLVPLLPTVVRLDRDVSFSFATGELICLEETRLH